MEKLSQKHRKWLMARVRSVDTKPELILRSLLHREGFRYSLNRRDLPGKPDIVMRKYNVVIFVNGCFWHQHNRTACKHWRSIPKTNSSYWKKKLQLNVERDRNNISKLHSLGWRIITVWECEILNSLPEVFPDLVRKIKELGKSTSLSITPDYHRAIMHTEKKHRSILRKRTGSKNFQSITKKKPK